MDAPNGQRWLRDPKSMWVGSRKRAANQPADVHPPTDFWGFLFVGTQSRTTAVVCAARPCGTVLGQAHLVAVVACA
jgi:hypothetical protein